MKKRFLVATMAIVFAAMQISMLGAGVASADTQVNGGYTECDTTLQMIPMTHTIGGGTIHWHITGENAKELRTLILERLDNASINYEGRLLLPNDTAAGRKQGVIDEAEVWAYVAAGDHSFLQNYLQGIQKMWVNNQTGVFEMNPSGDNYKSIMFHGVDITRASLSNNRMYVDTSGLLNQGVDSTADIDIFMTISMKDTVRVNDIDLSNPAVLEAPFRCLTAFDRNGDAIDTVNYHGDGSMQHWTISVGFDSFYNPEIRTGKLYLIRTPAGELYKYQGNVQDGSIIQESMQHSDFNPVENPQILFIIMMVFGYLTVALPGHFYLKYRSKYPKKHRSEAKKLKGVHWTARIFLLLLILFYFWPVLGTFYLTGAMYIGLSVGFVIISGAVGKFAYERAENAIPPEYFEKKEKKKVRTFAPVAPLSDDLEAEPYISDTEKIHCIRCGALITIKNGENLLKVKCPVCGALQKKVERGYNHLILDSNLTNTYNMFADFLRDGDTALCMSTTMPGKLKRNYGLSGKLKCVWLTSAGGKDTLDPGDINKIAETVERFAEKFPASLVLFDGLEYMVVDHGFDAASRFLKRITDVASMKDITLLVPINPASLTEEELTALKAIFDRVEALEDIDERESF